jgi:hypothetical protein
MIHIDVAFPWWQVPVYALGVLTGQCIAAYVSGYISGRTEFKRMTEEERRAFLSS